MSEVYFAADDPRKKVSYLIQKGENWFNGIKMTNYFQKIRLSWEFYHGLYYSASHTISYGGELGEYVNIAANHYNNIANHMIKMVTSQRPAFSARSTNTDVKSMIQTKLANGLLEYYMRDKELEKCLRTAVEYAVVMTRGYIKMEWSPMSGEIYDYLHPESQLPEGENPANTEDLLQAGPEKETQSDKQKPIPIFEGDVKFTNLTPFDVVYDINRSSLSDQDWVMCRISKNKFDLAAQYPEMKDKILSMSTKDKVDGQRVSLLFRDETSDIYVYEFFHKKTAALPEGNYCLFLDPDTILIDAPIPYRELPIYSLSFAEILGTSFSYTTMFDLLPIQQGINALNSTIMTNINAHGIPNIIAPRESGVKLSHIEGGMNFIEYDAAIVGNNKPEPLNLLRTAPEVYKYLDKLEQQMEILSGVNAVVRGDPQASLKSGSALALVNSQALQFVSGLQQGYVQLIEKTGTGLINMLRDFAHSPRVAAISGVSNKTNMKYFTGDDISLVNRVIVDAGNALAQTAAGRLQMASDLIQMGLIKRPEDYMSVLMTGKLESMTESEDKELLLIRDENERITSGEGSISALAYDLHSLHIREHRSVAADSTLREDPGLMQRLNEHINEHLQLAAETRQDLLHYIGEPQFMAQPAPGQSPPPNPAAKSGAPGGQNITHISQSPMHQQMNPNEKQAQAPKLPQPAQSPNGQPSVQAKPLVS